MARTLFPPRTATFKASNTPLAKKRTALESSSTFFSPIPSVLSPLVSSNHHAQSTVTPIKHPLDTSIASASLFETPTKDSSHRNGEESCGASASQEMFTSPEIFTPLVDDVANETATMADVSAGHEDEDMCEKEQSPPCTNNIHSIPSSNESCIDQSLLDNSPEHKPLSNHNVDLHPIIHSTPVCHTNISSHPPPSHPLYHTPDVPSEHAHEPSPHCGKSTTPEDEHTCVLALPSAETSPKAETTESAQTSYKFESTDNVLDLLFMSPTQLDEYLSKSKNGNNVTSEKRRSSPSCKQQPDIEIPDNKDCVTIPATQQSPCTVEEAVESDLTSTDLDTKPPETKPEIVKSDLPVVEDGKIHEATDKEDISHKQGEAKVDSVISENLPLSADLQECQPPMKRLKRKATNCFLYPGSKRLTCSKKRTRYVVKKEDAQNPSPKNVFHEGLKRLQEDQSLAMTHDDNDEPPSKKPHVDNCSPEPEVRDESITKVDESLMEQLSQKSGGDGVQFNSVMDTKHVTLNLKAIEEKLCTTKAVEQPLTHTVTDDKGLNGASDQINSDDKEQQENETVPSNSSKDMKHSLTIADEISNNTPLSIEKSTVKRTRAPGLSRRYPVVKKPNLLRETSKEQSHPLQSSHSSETLMPYDSVKQPDTVSTNTLSTANAPQFVGFCTAGGSSISISNQAMQKAKSLLSEELEWKDEELESASKQLSTESAGKLALQEKEELSKPSAVVASSSETPASKSKMESLLSPFTPSYVPTDLSKATSVSAYKTPLNVQHKISRPVSSATLPSKSHVLSRTKRPASSFKAPRKADNVSKDEEKAAIARILRGFRASGAGSSSKAMSNYPQKKVESSPKKQVVSGFSTAAGNKLTISSESIEKAQQLLLSDKENGMVDNHGLQNLPETSVEREEVGFKTASGKGLSVSSSAMVRAKEIAKSVEQADDLQKNVSKNEIKKEEEHVSVGFQTASGKSLSVSSKSLAKAESVMSSISEESLGEDYEGKPNLDKPKNPAVLLTGFQTAGGRNISVSSKSLDRAQKIIDEEKQDNQSGSNDEKSGKFLTGFSTAGGSAISVSKKSLVKAQSDMEGDAEKVYPSEVQREEENTMENVKDILKNPEEEALDSHCLLTVEDVDTLNCFTQVTFHRTNSQQVSTEPQSDCQTEVKPEAASQQTCVQQDLSTVHMEKLDEDLSGDEDSHCHYFSTQVVKQLLEFSSDEEMSVSGGDDRDHEVESLASKIGTENCQEEKPEQNYQLSAEQHPPCSPSQVSSLPGMNHTEEQPSPSVEPIVVEQDQVDIEVGTVPEDSTENDDSLLNEDDDILTESMVESMNISAIAASCCEEFAGLRSQVCQQNDQATQSAEARSSQTTNIIPKSLEAVTPSLDSNIGNPPTGRFPGLQTASGAQVNISKESLEAARATIGSDSNASGFPGLQTASGNEVPISEESLEAAKALLDGNTNRNQDSSFPGLQTARGNKVTVSKESLDAARSVLNANTSTLVTSGFPGLKTASGSKVNISKESLEAAKARLDGGSAPSQTNGFPGLQTASGAQVNISKESLEAAKVTLDGASTSRPHTSGFPGLQTARGNKVNISEESLEAVRSVLDGSGSSKPNFPGLQTASGNRVSISNESMNAARSMLHSKTSTLSFPSLQTASGAQVSISKESLEAARTTLDGGSSEPRTSGSLGLQTASGNKVDISKESLEAVKTVLDSHTSKAQVSGFSGLQTASGAPVSISEESLKAARATISDGGSNVTKSNSFPSFETAGGTTVEVSRKSLDAAKAVLNSSDSSEFSNSNSAISTRMKTIAEPSCTSQQTSGRILSSSDSSKPPEVQDGKYRPIFKVNTAKRGSFQVPTVNSTGSVHNESSKIGSDMCSSRVGSYQQEHTTSTRGVISTPEGRMSIFYTYMLYIIHIFTNAHAHTHIRTHVLTATLCDRVNHPKRRPLLPSQPPLERPGYSHSLPTTSIIRNQTPHNRFKTPHRHSVSSVQFQQDTNARYSSPSSYSGNYSATKTPISSQPTSANRGFSYPRAVSSKPSSTCTPVWKASLGKKTPSTNTGYKNHRRSIVFTPVQRTPVDKPVATTPNNQQHNFNSSFLGSQKSKTQTLPSSETPMKLSSRVNVPSTSSACTAATVRTSTQINTTSSNDNNELSIPLSPLHITLSQLNAMDEIDSQTQGIGDVGKDATTKTTNDSGYMSREGSTAKSPSPGTELENRKLTANICRQSEQTIVENAGSSSREYESYEIDEEVFAEVAKERLDDSLEVSDTEVPDEILQNTTHKVQQGNYDTNHNLPKHHNKQSANKTQAAKPSNVFSTKRYEGASSAIIRPQTGSLLAVRDEHKSCRIPLRSAVKGRPPGRYTQHELHSFGVQNDVISVTASNAVNFCFSGAQYFSSAVLSGAVVCVGDGAMLTLLNGKAGVEQFWETFRVSPGVDEKLISFKWFSNHYKQLVWKLASMECSYPELFAGRCLTPDWLMVQMKYRYDREIDRAQRPALCKICEQDDVPSRRMVLCVSHVHREGLYTGAGNESLRNQNMESGNETLLMQNDSIREEQSSSSATSDNINPPCIVLTDGWYSLPAVVDPPLKHMLKSGRISIGTKLLVCGAELLGLSEPCHPLEAPGSCCLKISSNSTRRARWFARLGYQTVPHPFPVPLESIYPEGGVVGCTHTVIARIYPTVYLEKKDGCKSVFRNEKMELKIVARYEAERQKKIDHICSRVQREFEEEVADRGKLNSNIFMHTY